MGEYTKSLQLYKADVVENANDTFNIETMLNDNWDKIDEKLEKLPIQNGGLYINSETTEEDKAEAVEAIKEIGLSASDVGAAAQEYVWAVEEKVENKLPLDGNVPMNGSIDFAAKGADYNTDSWFAIGMDNESISLLSRKNGKNRRLSLNNITSSLTDALRLWYYDDGNEHTARIFGEHNTSLLASTIQSLIDSGVIEVGGFKSPIKIQRGSAGTTAVTGTGKGKLFFNADYHSDLTLVVDGLTLVSNKENPSAYHNAEVEFTKSFSIKSSTDNYPIGYTAVFY